MDLRGEEEIPNVPPYLLSKVIFTFLPEYRTKSHMKIPFEGGVSLH